MLNLKACLLHKLPNVEPSPEQATYKYILEGIQYHSQSINSKIGLLKKAKISNISNS